MLKSLYPICIQFLEYCLIDIGTFLKLKVNLGNSFEVDRAIYLISRKICHQLNG